MTTLLPRRAALSFAALLLAGCASFGPAATPAGMATLQPLLVPEDGPLEFSTLSSFFNQRMNPTLGQALLLGVRNEPMAGVIAFTENSLIAAIWTGDTSGYRLVARIPFREIVAISTPGLTAIDVETNVPRHIALGQPPQTGLYRFIVDIRPEVIERLRRKAPHAGSTPQ